MKGLWLTVTHSSQLVNQCDEFQHLMDDAVLLVNEQTSCHQAIADSLVELKVRDTSDSIPGNMSSMHCKDGEQSWPSGYGVGLGTLTS